MLSQLSKHKYTSFVRSFSHKHSVKKTESKLCKNCKYYEAPNFYDHNLEFYPIETIAKCKRFRDLSITNSSNSYISAWNCRTNLSPPLCGPKGLFFEKK